MNARTRLRGEPVLVLAILLGGWVAMRAAVWETPFAKAALDLPAALLASGEHIQAPAALRVEEGGSAGSFESPLHEHPSALIDPLTSGTATPVIAPVATPATIELPDPLRPKLVPFTPVAPMPPRLAAAHNMLLFAGLSKVSLPPELASLLVAKEGPQSAPYQPLTTFAKSPTGGRWSGDGWLLLRGGSTTALAPGQGSYGSSQAGAVLRFSLAPSSPFRPLAYARVSQALGGASESELAFGLSARPLPKLPLRAAAELRVTRSGGRTLARPAGYVVTELPRFDLPLGFTADAYGQAGYVGGKNASAFADGQVRAERRVFDLGKAQLSAGGGAWGGAQKGAARLDIGPSASVQLKLGETNSRLSMDWRFRVAGDARPASGPALTISAGF